MTDSQETNQSNPEIGMQKGSLEEASESYGRGEHPNSQANLEPNTSGSQDFFDDLDQTVNGGIIEDNPEVTQNQLSGPEQVTHAQDDGSKTQRQSADSTDWEKRYKDSSREAVKWREQYKQVEPFVPVLDAMKNDGGLVQHVKDYLVNGGTPAKSIQDQMGLDEDFVFDQNEAMTNPDSDSAKVMNAHVDTLVKRRMSSMIDNEKKRSSQVAMEKQRRGDEIAFMKKHSMSEDDFAKFKTKAKTHTMTLDDVNYILNKDQTAANVASSTKTDMLNQMKNVRNMPISASGANSQKVEKSQDREVFDNILGFEGGVDNLFG